jgi:hypothetical protein
MCLIHVFVGPVCIACSLIIIMINAASLIFTYQQAHFIAHETDSELKHVISTNTSTFVAGMTMIVTHSGMTLM